MPFVARHAEGGRLDATFASETEWAAVHVRGAPLTCPQCALRLVAAVSPLGLRYFRHHRRPQNCELGRESVLHLTVKRAIVAAVRVLPGWTAEPEAPGDGWRADVLATGPNGQRVAFEAQVSSIGAEAAGERTRRLTASGITVCWLAPREWKGLRGGTNPWAWIRAVGEHATVFEVIGGAEVFTGWWHSAPVLALAPFVQGVCRGTVLWAKDRPLTDQPAWTTPRYLAAAQAQQDRQVHADRESAELLRRTEHRIRRGPPWNDSG
jgi:hypothetical protein